ncbi:MAG: serine hydrolase domain-containing protein [Phenylobacterium sp.]
MGVSSRRELVAMLAASAVPASTAFAQRRNAALEAAASPETLGFSSERLRKLDAAMARAVADGQVKGMTTYLARHGKVVAFNTYGEAATGRPMTRDAIFRIYSMTKPITGVAMMILFEEGRWRLDDPVSRYIPEFANLKVAGGVDAQGRPILEATKTPVTMRQLMSHTGGFGYGYPDEGELGKQFNDRGVMSSNGLQEMIDKLAALPLLNQPGERWRYSVSVDIQGYLVQKLSGQPFGQFLQERIFAPLRMSDTAFHVAGDRAQRLARVYVWDAERRRLTEQTQTPRGGPPHDYTRPPPFESGGGGLISTTSDYARFCQMILNGGELDGARILSPASVELMGANAIPDRLMVNTNGGGLIPINQHVGFGMDFMLMLDPRRAGTLEGKGTMSWGGAAGTWFWIDPQNDLFFVGMIQRMGDASPAWPSLPALSRTLVYQALLEPQR